MSQLDVLSNYLTSALMVNAKSQMLMAPLKLNVKLDLCDVRIVELAFYLQIKRQIVLINLDAHMLHPSDVLTEVAFLISLDVLLL